MKTKSIGRKFPVRHPQEIPATAWVLLRLDEVEEAYRNVEKQLTYPAFTALCRSTRYAAFCCQHYGYFDPTDFRKAAKWVSDLAATGAKAAKRCSRDEANRGNFEAVAASLNEHVHSLKGWLDSSGKGIAGKTGRGPQAIRVQRGKLAIEGR